LFDDVGRSYHRSFNLPIIITRSNNVYGPHQYPEKIIPKFISLLSRGRKWCLARYAFFYQGKSGLTPLIHLLQSYIHGSGTNKRNYIFATDVARAFDRIIHNGELGIVLVIVFLSLNADSPIA